MLAEGSSIIWSVPPCLKEWGGFYYLISNIFPTLFLRPDLVVGIPVALAIFFFADVMPSARFQLKERLGINEFFFRHLKHFPS